MMDQYNMDQYNRETSQIHAPEDLIRRTKEAVREEEQRLAGANLKQYAVTQSKRSYAKVYRWALPVAAAIFCVVLLNVGLLRFRKDMGGSGSSSATTGSDTTAANTASGGAKSNDLGLQFETAATYEEAAEAADEPVDNSSAMDMAAGVTAEMTNGVDKDGTSRAMAEEEQGSYIDSIYGSDLWIEKVDEEPFFYGDSDTEIISIHGIKIYVAKDTDDTWIAYAQIGEGRYVIRGELTEESINQEEFVEKAYQLLEETMDRSK